MSDSHRSKTPPLTVRVDTADEQVRVPIDCDLGTRYFFVRTIHNSLFGEIRLMFDKLRAKHVAVKMSRAELVTPRHASSTRFTAQSIQGVSVLEDVRREARILRLLTGDEYGRMSKSVPIDVVTCGVADVTMEAARLGERALEGLADAICRGKTNIVTFVEERETPKVHCLVTRFISGGDIFVWQRQQPLYRIPDAPARSIFVQLCEAVRYMHAHSVAHMDLSIENVCMDHAGHVSVIDFGLAMQHPRCGTAAGAAGVRNCSEFITLADEPPADPSCFCASCQRPPVQSTANNSLPFLCRPICQSVHKPGKLGYMSYELANDLPWDAYANDMFCLGVILYTMVAGQPPFTCQNSSTDPWFDAIYSGKWLRPDFMALKNAGCYNRLSPSLLNLIDSLIAPQEQRLTISAALKHPWLRHDLPTSKRK